MMEKGEKVYRKQNPRRKANPFSVITFWWTFPIFREGLRKVYVEEDLFEPLPSHQSRVLGDRLENAWKTESKSPKPSLWKALIKVFGLEFLGHGLIFLFLELVFKLSQPLALRQLILYYTPNQTQISKSDAFVCATIIVGASLLNVLIVHTYVLGLLHLGMKMRIACCSLIYRKSLNLSKRALAQTTIGQLVNLLSNDVNKFDYAVLHVHCVWVAPIEISVILYILYALAGVSAMVGVFFMLGFIPLQMYLGKQVSNFRMRTALRTDERIRFMNEIISGIQVIKMYTWEKPFAKLVALTRKLEIKQIKVTSQIRGLNLCFSIFLTRFAIFLSILTLVMLGHTVNAEYVFVITSFYNILRQMMTIYFAQGVAEFAQVAVSISRLRTFLLYEEIDVDKNVFRKGIENGIVKDENRLNAANNENCKFCVDLQNVSAKWIPSSLDNTLSGVSIQAEKPELIAVVGPVGCGKSSLLQVILGELPITEGSVTMSGKISYATQEPWLFSSSIKQNILFGQPMNPERYQEVIKVCALERDISLLPYGDRTLVGERGMMLSGGQRTRVNLARTVYKVADIYLLDDPLSAVDTHVGKQLFEDCITHFLKDKCVFLVTHQLQYLLNVKHILLMENGQILSAGSYKEIRNSNVDFAKELNGKSEMETSSGDISENIAIDPDNSPKYAGTPVKVKEMRSTGKIGSDVYKSYCKAGGRCYVVVLLLTLFVLAQLSASGSDYFIAYWVNQEQYLAEHNATRGNATELLEDMVILTRETSVYVYSGIIFCIVILTLTRAYAFYSFCMIASVNLHDQMFSNIIGASMKFFKDNTSGMILNRFSKDMGSIDELLPSVIMDCMQIGLTVLGIIAVLSVVNTWVLICVCVMLVIFYMLKNIYLRTSRSVKRLEGITRSPVFSHVNATLQGLTTIRAFGAQEVLKKEFDHHQDLNSSAYSLFVSCSRAFGFWLDLICVIFIGIVTFSFVVLQTEKYGGNVGLSITQALMLTGMFQWGMRQWSELENQMTCVERVVEYTKVPLEIDARKKAPRSTWPELGGIKFQNVSLRYSNSEPFVLKNLNINIIPKEKIGIVGRTGAGKSSLMYALFQLCETEGVISIDDLDTKVIPHHVLRSKISIIPQEPVLFSGSLRKNLDPFDEFTDSEIWKVLDDVELKGVVEDLPVGLHCVMTEGGRNFSVGQRQLVCLARAIIRNNRILVMDEATANVDSQTDALIQKTIRKNFADCTVLIIAHRLHTIMDSDKVLVMDAGCAVEFDHPYNLLQDKGGFFFGLLQETGKVSTERLYKIAETGFYPQTV